MRSDRGLRDWLPVFAAAVAAIAALVSVAGWRGPGDYLLYDAWIHQTYARNLSATGQWAYVPGEPSAGSTSPLWTLPLAAGHEMGPSARARTLMRSVAYVVTFSSRYAAISRDSGLTTLFDTGCDATRMPCGDNMMVYEER